MLISLIFFYSAVELTFVNPVRSKCSRNSAVTELDRFHSHVLRRSIRSLVFPKKAQLLLTPAFAKAILDGRPRGLLYSVEFDMYSPLPDSIGGWKPTILRNKSKDKETTSEPLKTSLLQTTDVSRDNYLTEDSIQPHFPNNYYDFPFHEGKGTKVVNWDWKSKAMNSSNRNFETYPNEFYGIASNFHKLPYSGKKYKRSTNISSRLRKKFTTHDAVLIEESIHGLQSDREREQIHKQFEMFGKIFKINIRKCMHRAICELNSQLRRHGESVMNDIIRLVLDPSYRSNTPIDRGNTSNILCKKKFAVSCPYTVLHGFTKMFNFNM